MNLAYVPLLGTQRKLYSIPAGMERFQAYLGELLDDTGDDLRQPLAAMNPMGKGHVPELLDAYLEFDADSIGARATAEVAAEVAAVPGDFKISLVMVDDAKGGWTNRYATEFEHCFGEAPLRRRGWLVGFIWTSEKPSAHAVRAEIRAVVHRAAYVSQHGPAQILREMLAQEGTVLMRADAARYENEIGRDELDYTRVLLAEYLDANDPPTLMSAFFGDNAARAFGYAPLGLSMRAGFALALNDAKNRLANAKPDSHL